MIVWSERTVIGWNQDWVAAETVRREREELREAQREWLKEAGMGGVRGVAEGKAETATAEK